MLSLQPRPGSTPLDLARLDLEVPNLTFPFDLAGGIRSFRHRRNVVRRARVRLDDRALQEHVGGALAQALGPPIKVRSAALRFEDGLVRLDAHLQQEAWQADLSALGFLEALGSGELRLLVFENSVHGHVGRPVPLLIADLVRSFAPDPTVGAPVSPLRRVGACDLVVDPLALALETSLPPWGWRMPDRAQARVADPWIDGGAITVDYGPVANDQPPRPAPSGRHLAAVALHREAAVIFGSAESALAAGDLDEALAQLGDDSSPFALMRRLQILAARPTTFRDAEALARKTLMQRPTFTPAHLGLASVAEAEGDHAAVLTSTEALLALAESAGDPDAFFLAACWAARACERLGRHPEAARHYERALEVNGEHPAAAVAQASLGALRLSWGADPPSARQAFEQAVVGLPEDAAVWEGLGRTALRERDLPGADAAFARSLDIARARPSALAGASRVALLRGDAAKAEELASLALGLDSRQREALLTAGLLATRRGDAAGATRLLLGAATPPSPPDVRSEALGHMVLVARQAKDRDAERQALNQLINHLDIAGHDAALAERLTERAALAAQEGRAEDATEDRLRAADLAPDSLTIALGAAEAAFDSGRHADAIARLEDVLSKPDKAWTPAGPDAPMRAALERKLAAWLEKLGAIDRALAALVRCLDAGASGVLAQQAWQRIIDLNARRGDAHAAARALEDCASDERTHETPTERAERLVAAAEIRRLRLGEAASLMPLLDRALALDPRNATVLGALEAAATAAGDWPRLAEVLERCAQDTARRPRERASAMARLAHIKRAHLGAPNEARALASDALAMDPSHVSSLVSLAEDALSQGRSEEARAHWRRLAGPELDAPPTVRAEAHTKLAEFAAAEGDLLGAEAEARAALTHQAHNLHALDLLISWLEAQERWSDLAATLAQRASFETEGDLRRDLEMRRADVSARHGHLPDAIAAWRNALKARPFFAPALLKLADALRTSGDPAGLAKVLERLIELRESERAPELASLDVADLVLELARLARSDLRDPARAEICLLKLLVKRPESRAALAELTSLLVQRGAIEEADRLFDRRLQLAQTADEMNALVVERARMQRVLPNGEALAYQLLASLDRAAMATEALDLRADLAERRRELGDAARTLVEWANREVATDRDRAAALRARARDLARALLDRADTVDEGREILEQLLAADPYDQAAADALAAAFSADDDPTSRAECLTGLLARAPGLAPARRATLWSTVGRARESLKEVALAENAYAHALALATDAEERTDLLVAHARVLLRLEDQANATVDLDEALTINPEHAVALAMQGDLAYEQHEWQRAHEVYERLARLPGPKGVSMEVLEWRRAELAEMFGDNDGAEASYRAVAAAMPAHAEAREALAQAATWKGDHAEAARLWQEVAALLPKDEADRLAEVRLRLADARIRLGDLDAARELLELVVAHDPDRLTALELLAEVCERRSRWSEAAEMRERLARLHTSPHDRAQSLHRQAEIFRQHLGRSEDAHDLDLKAVDLDATLAPALARLLEHHHQRGEIEAALDVARDLLRTDRDLARVDLLGPGSASLATALAWVSDRMGRLGSAAVWRTIATWLGAGAADAPDAGALPLPPPTGAALDAKGTIVHATIVGPWRATLVNWRAALPKDAALTPDPGDAAQTITPKRSPALAAIVGKLGSHLGVTDVVIETRADTGGEPLWRKIDPPTLLLPESLLALPQAEFMFNVACAFERLRSGATVASTLPPAHLPPGFSLATYVDGCAHTAHRIGLLLCGSPEAAFRAMARSEGVDPDAGHAVLAAWLRRSQAAHELLRWIAAGGYDLALGLAT